MQSEAKFQKRIFRFSHVFLEKFQAIFFLRFLRHKKKN